MDLLFLVVVMLARSRERWMRRLFELERRLARRCGMVVDDLRDVPTLVLAGIDYVKMNHEEQRELVFRHVENARKSQGLAFGRKVYPENRFHVIQDVNKIDFEVFLQVVCHKFCHASKKTPKTFSCLNSNTTCN
jgi:hypothetical protein